MSAKNRNLLYELAAYSPTREAIICLAVIPFVLIATYFVSAYMASTVVLVAGIVLTMLLAVLPVRIGIAIFLLWKNPRKYKEYEMKRIRIERKKTRRDDD